MNIMCFSQSLLIKALTPYLIKSKNGASVINNGSACGAYLTCNAAYPYGLARAAQKFMSESWAIQLGEHNIRVNYLATGDVLSGTHVKIGGPEFEKQYLAARIHEYPLKRFGQMADVTQLVLFLIDSTKSGWITGEVFNINGGCTISKL
jgi:NAD(P)-dependent dehydrogenase (short-subunit alcohol dehydrogenase family)